VSDDIASFTSPLQPHFFNLTSPTSISHRQRHQQ
jgi:hypothetical protein